MDLATSGLLKYNAGALLFLKVVPLDP